MGPLFCSEEQHALLELEQQPLVTEAVSSSQPPDESKRRYLPHAGGLLLACGGILLLLHVPSQTSVTNSKLLSTISLTDGGEDTTFLAYLGYNCYPNSGAWGSDCGDLLSTSPETCAAKCSGCPGCQSYTVSQPDADGRVDCWTHSWTTVSECGQNTSFSTYVRVCGEYQCPDSFQQKPGSYQLERPRPGVCCEEALCSCGHGRSGFFCNQQVLENDCGEDFECALEPSLTWRYSTDRFVACKRLTRLEPSHAPLHSFYVYRSARAGEDVNSGINVANAVGQIARLLIEIVHSDLAARNGITTIRRMKVTIRATSRLQHYQMSFGPYHNYDGGKCGGIWYPYYILGWNETMDHCGAARQKYGSSVGCTRGAYGEYWQGRIDDDLLWYSLPGPCSTVFWGERDAECVRRDPGGLCTHTDTPTGAEDCTYFVEAAGTISIGELCGLPDIASYEMFYENGGQEWDWAQDKGVNCSFWDNAWDPAELRRKARTMEKIFVDKFGAEDLEPAFCDYCEDQYRQDACAEATLLDSASNNTAGLADQSGC